LYEPTSTLEIGALRLLSRRYAEHDIAPEQITNRNWLCNPSNSAIALADDLQWPSVLLQLLLRNCQCSGRAMFMKNFLSLLNVAENVQSGLKPTDIC